MHFSPVACPDVFQAGVPLLERSDCLLVAFDQGANARNAVAAQQVLLFRLFCFAHEHAVQFHRHTVQFVQLIQFLVGCLVPLFVVSIRSEFLCQLLVRAAANDANMPLSPLVLCDALCALLQIFDWPPSLADLLRDPATVFNPGKLVFKPAVALAGRRRLVQTCCLVEVYRCKVDTHAVQLIFQRKNAGNAGIMVIGLAEIGPNGTVIHIQVLFPNQMRIKRHPLNFCVKRRSFYIRIHVKWVQQRDRFAFRRLLFADEAYRAICFQHIGGRFVGLCRSGIHIIIPQRHKYIVRAAAFVVFTQDARQRIRKRSLVITVQFLNFKIYLAISVPTLCHGAIDIEKVRQFRPFRQIQLLIQRIIRNYGNT